MATDNSSQSDVTLNDSISVDNSVTQTQQTDATADSSTAQVEGAKQPSTLDLVKEALKQPTGEDSDDNTTDSPTEGKGKEASTDVKSDTSQDDAQKASDEEDKKLPFHNHPRWKAVIAERDELKVQLQQLDSVKQEVASFKDRAERFDMVSNFVQQNGLESQEIDTGFAIMAAIANASKFGGDPQAALDLLTPYVTHLQSLTGSVMPDDLQKKVDEGYLDLETAQDIAKLRAENNRVKQTANVAQQRAENVQQLSQQEQQQKVVGGIMDAVTKWEKNWKDSDPDYAIKQADVMMLVENLQNKHGKPRTVEDALYLANFAKEKVDEKYKNLLPKKNELRTVTGGNVKGTPVPQANNVKDAVQLALQGKYKMNSPSTLGA